MIKQAADAPSAAKSGADDLRKRVTALARQLGAPVNAGDQGPEGGGGPFGAGAQAVRNQIATLKGQIMAATAAPTSAQTMRAAELREDLAKLIAELNDVISTRLPDLQRMTLDSRLSPSPMKPIPPVTMPSLTGR